MSKPSIWVEAGRWGASKIHTALPVPTSAVLRCSALAREGMVQYVHEVVMPEPVLVDELVGVWVAADGQ